MKRNIINSKKCSHDVNNQRYGCQTSFVKLIELFVECFTFILALKANNGWFVAQ